MVLKNILNIDDSVEPAREEEKLSKKAAVKIFESGRLDEMKAGTFEALCEIHRELFMDVYGFAGKLRTENISKGAFRFAPAMYLEQSVRDVKHMPQSTFDEIIEKYVEMNIAHPFREGNGRATRIWLDQMLKRELKQVIDWSLVDKDDYLMAMERSPVKDIEIKHVLRNALTDRINDREIFMKGIDHSYYYEGYKAFNAKSIDQL